MFQNLTRKYRSFARSLAVFTLLAQTPAFALAGFEVTVKIEGLRSGAGHFALSLFDQNGKDGFPGDDTKAQQTLYFALDGKQELTVTLKDLVEGDYAVSVMHDESSDRKMNFNFLGIPKEGAGFSLNPKVYFGPPSFDKAKVHFSNSSPPLLIKMKYFL